MLCYLEHPSPLGILLLASTEQGLCGLYFSDHKYFKGKDGWRNEPEHRHLTRAARQLDEYFAGQRTTFELQLHMIGTDFQRAVWQGLLAIPYGETVSYGMQAQRIGHPNAVRAVGAANGRNPISIIVPCHRVIGASGKLSGYAGGLEHKHYLLAFEKRTLGQQLLPLFQ